jgi:hypothetical protein
MEARMTSQKKDRKDELDEKLEEGLKGTFPASDPPAATQPVHKPHERDE